MNPDPATNPTPETPTPLGLLPLPPTPLTNKLESEFEQAEYTNAVCKLFSHAKDLERALAEAKREVGKVNDFRERLRAKHRQVCDERDQLSSLAHQLKAEIERLKAERQWQPIETYDKDGIRMLNGRRVLGWCEEWDDVFIVKWSPIRPKPHWTTDDGAVTEHAPTHWMLLPAARTQEGQG